MVTAKSRYLLIMAALLYVVTGCNQRVEVHPKVRQRDTFYSLANLFMLKQEKELYKRLTDRADIQEFIREFWTRRDPSPATPENEFRIALRGRITYANTWFWRTRGSRQSGWDSDRGRIYLVLGPPDRVVFWNGLGSDNGSWEGRRNRISKQWRNETWFYYRYFLQIYFKKIGHNDYRLNGLNQALVNALEDMKLFYVNGNTTLYQEQTRPKLHLEENQIILEIPIGWVEFIEAEKRMTTEFTIKIKVYKNNRKIHQIQHKKTVTRDPEKLLGQGIIKLAIPIEKTLTGRHLLFVEVKNLQSNQTIFERKYLSFKK